MAAKNEPENRPAAIHRDAERMLRSTESATLRTLDALHMRFPARPNTYSLLMCGWSRQRSCTGWKL